MCIEWKEVIVEVRLREVIKAHKGHAGDIGRLKTKATQMIRPKEPVYKRKVSLLLAGRKVAISLEVLLTLSRNVHE